MVQGGCCSVHDCDYLALLTFSHDQFNQSSDAQHMVHSGNDPKQSPTVFVANSWVFLKGYSIVRVLWHNVLVYELFDNAAHESSLFRDMALLEFHKLLPCCCLTWVLICPDPTPCAIRGPPALSCWLLRNALVRPSAVTLSERGPHGPSPPPVTAPTCLQVVDGAVSAQWLAAYRELIENPLTMLL